MSKIEVNEIDAQSGSTITVGSACKSVAVPGNVVKTNAVQASDGGNIVSQSGTTITLGASGDTINLASGASQSGFGRTGTVDWQTSIKTTSFTAVSGEGYFVNTTSGAVTMTLPASPSVGDIVAVKDYANTFDTNNLTLNRNGEPISGSEFNAIITVEGQAITLVYGDSTKGWQAVNAATEADIPKPSFIVATGGTITCCGNFKIHTFTGPGTFTVNSLSCAPSNNNVDYLVVAAGGGGGGHVSGGGGAGGYRTSFPGGTSVPVSVQPYSITVGGGGSGSPGATPYINATPGTNSVFSTITSTGGGGGGTAGHPSVPGNPGYGGGGPGGSGGGGGHGDPDNGPAGTGNTPPVSPPQGNPGGVGRHTGNIMGGGGGGASAAGEAGSPTAPGTSDGGDGSQNNIDGNNYYWAGGGGGGGIGSAPQGTIGTGGLGGGGGGGSQNATGGPGGGSALNTGGTGGSGAGTNGGAAGANTGGGGGGGAHPNGSGGSGGSGIVIIRYKFQ
jgi:hypothetical protein